MISKVVKVYNMTPKSKFFNPWYWIKVFICWPLPTRWMNVFSREKIYCMFDNMEDGNRLIINARCVPDADFLWKRNKDFTKFRLGRVFCKVSGTFMNEIWINYNGECFTIDNVKCEVVEGKMVKKAGVSIANLSPESEFPNIKNIIFSVNVGDMGRVAFHTIDRGVRLGFTPKYKASLTESGCRGALVSRDRAVELKYLEQILV